MVPGTQLASELLRTVDRRIDITAQTSLGVSERCHNLPEGDVTDHQQIKVACGPQLSFWRRAVKESYPDRLGQRSQRLADDLCRAGGLEEQLLKFGKDRRFSVRLKIHLAPFHCPGDKSRLGERPQFALHGALRGARLSGELAHVEALVRMPVQPC